MHFQRNWKRAALLALFIASGSTSAAEIGPPEGVSRVVFLGDSITYSGGYVEYVDAWLRLANPARKIEILDLGLPSETVSGLSEPGHAGGKFPRPDLHERLERVLAQTKPDLVVACYGMNCGIYHPFSEERFAKYQAGIKFLRERAAAHGARVLHLTPPVFDPEPIKQKTLPAGLAEYRQPYVGYNNVLDRYSAWLVAQRAEGWDVVDIHTPMNRLLADERAKDPDYRLANDGVHIGPAGHWLIARELLVHWGGGAALKKAKTSEELFAQQPHGAELLALVQQRERLLRDAWLTATGHQRPGMKAGLPLAEAQQQAQAIETKLAALGKSTASKPNIIVLLADDLGYSDLGCYGSEIETPNLDRLAAGGLRFTQFYNTARCWPSRAALLTGYYAQQVNRDPAGDRPAWAALLPELLAGAGYRSYHSGKWHVDGPILAGGFVRSYHVRDQDRYFSPRKHELDDQALPQPQPGDNYYATIAIADRAIDWLDEHRAKHHEHPFFLYVAFTSPHFPLHALAADIDRYRERYLAGWDVIRRQRFERIEKLGLVNGHLSDTEPRTIPPWNDRESKLQEQIGPQEVGYGVPWTELTPEQQRFQATKMAIHAAMIDRMDREIGRILARVEAIGATDNTLVCFASDNGASAEQIIRGDGHQPDSAPGSAESYLGLGPGWSTVANTPFRRHKSWTHEGGVSTPLVVRWPAGIPARGELRQAPGHLVDIAPTLLELAGVAPPTTWNDQQRPPLPGRSLVPIFAADTRAPHAPLFFKHQKNRGLRVGDWKIVAAGDDSPWELYDLATDRTETQDLASSQPEKVRELAAVWTTLNAEYAKQGATAAGGLKGKKAKRQTAEK